MSMGRMNISYVPGVGWKRAGDEIYRGRVTRRVLRSVGHRSLRRVTPRVIIASEHINPPIASWFAPFSSCNDRLSI